MGSRTGEDRAQTSYYVDGGTVWRGDRYVRARMSYDSNKLQKRVGFVLTGLRGGSKTPTNQTTEVDQKMDYGTNVARINFAM